MYLQQMILIMQIVQIHITLDLGLSLRFQDRLKNRVGPRPKRSN